MTKAEREKEKTEGLLREVRAFLPSPGKIFESYTFLAPEALWTGKMRGQPFVAVAEDRWDSSGNGCFLAVLYLDGVFAADLKKRTAIAYCASCFSYFMEIMEQYETARTKTPGPESVFDEEGYRRCKEAAAVLRERVTKIDPTALSSDLYFWSTRIEEFEAGGI